MGSELRADKVTDDGQGFVFSHSRCGHFLEHKDRVDKDPHRLRRRRRRQRQAKTAFALINKRDAFDTNARAFSECRADEATTPAGRRVRGGPPHSLHVLKPAQVESGAFFEKTVMII